ncbi:hypothetical protein Purlil1_2600 [Purpureocillium lilacinum]|uniref:Uncharacterized protein n=1 Tax=Purpureocillium lilacinum TaxID=33203 RepID=A0ABR0CBY7_PURLI|nr:hypothetical protein Purlil1_2600 [Purpureocillium lilacinum]
MKSFAQHGPGEIGVGPRRERAGATEAEISVKGTVNVDGRRCVCQSVFLSHLADEEKLVMKEREEEVARWTERRKLAAVGARGAGRASRSRTRRRTSRRRADALVLRVAQRDGDGGGVLRRWTFPILSSAPLPSTPFRPVFALFPLGRRRLAGLAGSSGARAPHRVRPLGPLWHSQAFQASHGAREEGAPLPWARAADGEWLLAPTASTAEWPLEGGARGVAALRPRPNEWAGWANALDRSTSAGEPHASPSRTRQSQALAFRPAQGQSVQVGFCRSHRAREKSLFPPPLLCSSGGRRLAIAFPLQQFCHAFESSPACRGLIPSLATISTAGCWTALREGKKQKGIWSKRGCKMTDRANSRVQAKQQPADHPGRVEAVRSTTENCMPCRRYESRPQDAQGCRTVPRPTRCTRLAVAVAVAFALHMLVALWFGFAPIQRPDRLAGQCSAHKRLHGTPSLHCWLLTLVGHARPDSAVRPSPNFAGAFCDRHVGKAARFGTRCTSYSRVCLASPALVSFVRCSRASPATQHRGRPPSWATGHWTGEATRKRPGPVADSPTIDPGRGAVHSPGSVLPRLACLAVRLPLAPSTVRSVSGTGTLRKRGASWDPWPGSQLIAAIPCQSCPRKPGAATGVAPDVRRRLSPEANNMATDPVHFLIFGTKQRLAAIGRQFRLACGGCGLVPRRGRGLDRDVGDEPLNRLSCYRLSTVTECVALSKRQAGGVGFLDPDLAPTPKIRTLRAAMALSTTRLLRRKVPAARSLIRALERRRYLLRDTKGREMPCSLPIPEFVAATAFVRGEPWFFAIPPTPRFIFMEKHKVAPGPPQLHYHGSLVAGLLRRRGARVNLVKDQSVVEEPHGPPSALMRRHLQFT